MKNNKIINELKNAQNVYCITHNDLDGYGCGQVLSSFLPIKECKFLSYGKIDAEIERFCLDIYDQYDALVIADVNISKNNIRLLSELKKLTDYPIIYFDHHYKNDETFEELKKSSIFNIQNTSICATRIMFDFFKENNFKPAIDFDIDRLDEIVCTIDSWDTFKFQDPNTFEILDENARDLNLYFKEFGPTKTLEKIGNYITKTYPNLFSNTEISNLMLIKREIKKAITDRNKNLEVIQYPFEGEIMDIGITYADKNISEIGNRLNILNKHLSFIVIVDMIHKNVGFRTIFDNPNLSKIAATYGGGGHPKAAGCELNEKAFNNFVNKTLSKEQVEALLKIRKEEFSTTATND